jgi:hypothetical protein
MNNNEITRGGRGYTGYDYKTVTTNDERASMLIDAYECFGWFPDDTMPQGAPGGAVTLKLKRDRKILNKAELTRLQQHFESCLDEIDTLDNSKTSKATMYSIAIGLIGTAFLAGSVFAVTAEPPLILLCIILGIPGLVGWALPYQLFKLFSKKRSDEVEPLIERKYDEMHEICEKGSALIH